LTNIVADASPRQDADVGLFASRSLTNIVADASPRQDADVGLFAWAENKQLKVLLVDLL
jgi:hypothetical protein